MIPTHFPSIRVRPVHLPTVATAVSARWGEGEEAPVRPEDPELRDRLRRMVRRLRPGDPLLRRHARYVAAMVLDETEAAAWRRHALEVLIALPRPLGVPILFRLYQDYFSVTALREPLARAHGEGHGPASLSPAHAASLFADDPVSEVALHCLSGEIGLSRLPDEFRLEAARPLCRAVILRLLQAGDYAWLRAQSRADVLSAFEDHLHDPGSWGAFLTLLVRAHGALSWKLTQVGDHPVLAGVFKLITTPRFLGNPDARPHDWQTVDPEVSALVRRWLVQRQVEGFFERVDATPDRRDFWRRAASVIEEIHEYPRCNAFAMRIGNLWFVEFGQLGNACYPYSLEDYERMRRLYELTSPARRTDPASMKSVQRAFRPPFSQLYVGWRTFEVGGGPLPHTPSYSGWHEKFEAYIKTFCDATLD